MKYLILILTTLPFVCNAGNLETIVPDDSDPFYAGKPRDTTADDQAAHCKQLRQRMDELKGRPQSRNAVIRRYKLECQPQYDTFRQPHIR